MLYFVKKMCLWLTLIFAPAVASRQCSCYYCDGRPGTMSSGTCSGRTLGCTFGNARGCYGVQGANTGTCNCASGEFSKIEQWALGGDVQGLAGGFEGAVYLTAHSTPLSKPADGPQGGGGAFQTIKVERNGPFVFPYKYASGELYEVSVSRDPPGKNCLVFFRSGPIYTDDFRVFVECHSVPPPPVQYTQGRQCMCYHCNSAGVFYEAQRCGGRSQGCGAAISTGCYGKAMNGTGGSCDCAKGTFSDPELFQIGGTVDGVPPEESVVLKASSYGHMGHSFYQTVVVTGSGRFHFPYDFKPLQSYSVSVVMNPLGQHCRVLHGATGSAPAYGARAPMAEPVRVQCRGRSTVMLGSTASMRDARRGDRYPPPPPPGGPPGGSVLWLFALIVAAMYFYQQDQHAHEHQGAGGHQAVPAADPDAATVPAGTYQT